MKDLWIKEVQEEVKEKQDKEDKAASGEMTQKDIEKGGEYFDIRTMMEDICKRAGAKKYIIKPYDTYHGPVCYVEKIGKFWMGKKQDHFVFDYAEGGSSSEMNVTQMVKEIKDLLKVDKVSFLVKAVWDLCSYTPPKGLFTESAESIALQLKIDSDSLGQAMSRLNFYINRAGDNLDTERKRTLDKSKDLLRGLFKKDGLEKNAIGHPPKKWWEEMSSKVKKNNPSYTKEVLDKVLGDIWHNKIDESKKREIVRRYEH